MLRKLQNILPKAVLPTIYECFIRPYADHGYQVCNSSFNQKIKSIEYNAVLALIGAIRDTSREKLNQGLGLESLELR